MKLMRFTLVIVLCLMWMGIRVPSVSAAGILNPTDDAFVRDKAGFRDTNFDEDADELRVTAEGFPTSAPVDIGYLRFDVSAFSGSITVVELRLYNQASPGPSVTVGVYSTDDDDWNGDGAGSGDETTLTFNNAPIEDSLLATRSGSSSPAWMVFSSTDLTTYVNQQSSGDGIVTLRIKVTSTGMADVNIFEDRENGGGTGNKPELSIIWTSTWNGTTDNDWHKAANWTPGIVPDSNADVVIPSGASVQLSANGASKSLTIANGATLDLGTFELTVEDTLTNDGTIKQAKTVNSSCTEADPCRLLYIQNAAGDADKYYGVDIVPTGGDKNMGNTTLEIQGNQNCGTTGTLPDTVKRCYEIDPTTSLAATLTFYYRSDEANGNSAPHVWHHVSGSTWEQETFVERGGSGEGMYVKVSGVDGYSPFALKDNEPTVVTLVSFTATGYDGYVLVEWETASEIDNLDFNLWRSDAADREYVKLNEALILAQGSPITGAIYVYTDTIVTNGVTYHYRLEDVDIYGTSTLHGPVTATPSRTYQLYLPLIVKTY